MTAPLVLYAPGCWITGTPGISGWGGGACAGAGAGAGAGGGCAGAGADGDCAGGCAGGWLGAGEGTFCGPEPWAGGGAGARG